MNPQFTGILLLLAATTVESFAQLFLKMGADAAAGRHASVRRKWTRPRWLLLGFCAYAVEIVLYTLALRFLDVSVAFPMGSLCFVGVAVLSRCFLGEFVGRVRWVGVGCIMAGTVFVAL